MVLCSDFGLSLFIRHWKFLLLAVEIIRVETTSMCIVSMNEMVCSFISMVFMLMDILVPFFKTCFILFSVMSTNKSFRVFTVSFMAFLLVLFIWWILVENWKIISLLYQHIRLWVVRKGDWRWRLCRMIAK